jgi:hypothetical protein
MRLKIMIKIFIYLSGHTWYAVEIEVILNELSTVCLCTMGWS